MDPLAHLQAVMKINRPAATIIAGGFLLISLSIYFFGWKEDLGVPFWLLPVILVALSLVVMALEQVPIVMRRLLAWILVLMVAIWLLSFFSQVMAQNRIPFLPTVKCHYAFLEETCQTPRFPADVAGAPVTMTTASEDEATDEAASDSVEAPDNDVPTEAAVVDRGRGRVFIQFAALPRDEVVAFARQLQDLGWDVQGADAGGERLASAVNLMEVRHFFAEDAELAAALADDFSAARPGNPEVAIRDLSRSSVASRARPGLLEIWIGR